MSNMGTVLFVTCLGAIDFICGIYMYIYQFIYKIYGTYIKFDGIFVFDAYLAIVGSRFNS